MAKDPEERQTHASLGGKISHRELPFGDFRDLILGHDSAGLIHRTNRSDRFVPVKHGPVLGEDAEGSTVGSDHFIDRVEAERGEVFQAIANRFTNPLGHTSAAEACPCGTWLIRGSWTLAAGDVNGTRGSSHIHLVSGMATLGVDWKRSGDIPAAFDERSRQRLPGILSFVRKHESHNPIRFQNPPTLGEDFSHQALVFIAPEMDTGMDLDEPYLVALEMFELEKGKGA